MAINRLIACFALASIVVASPVLAGKPSLEEFYLRQQMPVQYVPPVATPAEAQAKPEAPVSGSHVVTSVSKCFEELGPDESAEIKRNSLKPYADCQKRLRERALQKKADAAAPVAETPRNYKRVSDDTEVLPKAETDSTGSSGKTVKPTKKK